MELYMVLVVFRNNSYLFINKTDQVSPYFIANLFWYPAFENLFSIIRRVLSQKKNYLADNLHLHQLIFIYLSKKKLLKKYY